MKTVHIQGSTELDFSFRYPDVVKVRFPDLFHHSRKETMHPISVS